MQRHVFSALCLLGLVSGCAEPRPMADLMARPSPSFELGQLSRLVGTWAGTANIVSPLPEGAPDLPTSMRGESSFEWTLDGMYLKGEGWHDMPGDQRMHFVEYLNWDAKAGKYRSWMFDDWGNRGEGWMTFDDDGKTGHSQATMIAPTGARTRAVGTMTFDDDDTVEWAFTEKGSMGTMKLEGTMTRGP